MKGMLTLTWSKVILIYGHKTLANFIDW